MFLPLKLLCLTKHMVFYSISLVSQIYTKFYRLLIDSCLEKKATLSHPNDVVVRFEGKIVSFHNNSQVLWDNHFVHFEDMSQLWYHLIGLIKSFTVNN